MSVKRHPRMQREKMDNELQQQEQPTFFPDENLPLLATNTGVRLACTMAAMLSPFACFLCWAERDSLVIRRFAVQSAALLALHLFGGMLLGVISLIVGSIPYLGFMLTLLGWLVYIAIAVVVLLLRIKLMERAWHGRKFNLPLLEGFIRKFY